MKEITPEKFSRFEMKYILKEKLSIKIQREIENFMIYDGFATEERGNKYFVRSLYFDNLLNSNFNEKVDGVRTRHKYRIRTYSKNERSPIFIELKGRENKRTYKSRLEIAKENLHIFYDKSKYFQLKKIYPNNKLIDQFIFDCYKKNLIPRLLVDYNRKPFINKSGLYFRLTFDNHITSLKNMELFTNTSDKNWIECLAGYTILELKFNHSIPPWFQRIIHSYQLNIRSISKFVISADTLGIASDFEGK